MDEEGLVLIMMVEKSMEMGKCDDEKWWKKDNVEEEKGIKRIGERKKNLERKEKENNVVEKGMECLDKDMEKIEIEKEERRIKKKREIELNLKMRKKRMRKLKKYMLKKLNWSKRIWKEELEGYERKDEKGGNRREIEKRKKVENGGKIGEEKGGEGRKGKRNKIKDKFKKGEIEEGLWGLRKLKRGKGKEGKKKVGIRLDEKKEIS